MCTRARCAVAKTLDLPLQVPAHQGNAHGGGHAVGGRAAEGGSSRAALLKSSCFCSVEEFAARDCCHRL
jgi:hypothetical protein